jgi:hypothetical protein
MGSAPFRAGKGAGGIDGESGHGAANPSLVRRAQRTVASGEALAMTEVLPST